MVGFVAALRRQQGGRVIRRFAGLPNRILGRTVAAGSCLIQQVNRSALGGFEQLDQVARWIDGEYL